MQEVMEEGPGTTRTREQENREQDDMEDRNKRTENRRTGTKTGQKTLDTTGIPLLELMCFIF